MFILIGTRSVTIKSPAHLCAALDYVGLISPQGTLLPQHAGGVPDAEVQLLSGHCGSGSPAAGELAEAAVMCLKDACGAVQMMRRAAGTHLLRRTQTMKLTCLALRLQLPAQDPQPRGGRPPSLLHGAPVKLADRDAAAPSRRNSYGGSGG